MLSKKYYKMFAELLKNYRTLTISKDDLIDNLSDLFKNDNSSFDSAKFKNAYWEEDR